MNDIRPDTSRLPRRNFFARFGLFLVGLVGIVVAIPVVGALLAPLLRQPKKVWRSVGPVDNFVVGKTVLVTFKDASPLPWSGPTSQTASWLWRKSVKEFIALSINCTHLGCPVRWISGSELFLCPCHGGVYYRDGAYAAGPPPKPLPRYPVRINQGTVEIMTSPLPITNI